MPTIRESDALEHLCPWNSFGPCRGAKCMAWAWLGPHADRCETDNLQQTEEGLRPVGSPVAPEGDGWEADGPTFKKGYHRSGKDNLPQATAQRWMRRRVVSEGRCDRGGSDQGYF